MSLQLELSSSSEDANCHTTITQSVTAFDYNNIEFIISTYASMCASALLPDFLTCLFSFPLLSELDLKMKAQS